MKKDAYHLSKESIREAPDSIRGRLQHLGPSFILSASIVGSGELIATTTLGAKAGFVTFWVILVSCAVKVAVQLEFGRHTLLTGETAMQAFNQLPGPKFGKANWSVWTILGIMVIKLLQLGGIIGGVAIIANMVFPALAINYWAILIAVVVALMIFRGYYQFIEGFSLIMIGLFTLFTFASLYFLTYTEYAINWADIQRGLQFSLPASAVAVAIGAFGITGVGGDEIIHYNYWCLEKGYARYVGPREDTEVWKKRAKAWIQVMYLDAILSMIVYTLMTAAFYLLGAAVLHARDQIPGGFEMIESLSLMYTESIGPGAKSFFLIGAFMVLFSTLFAALAAWTRQLSDIFGQIGWIDFFNAAERNRSIALLSWLLPMLWVIVFIFVQLPVLMVVIGGIVGSFLLFLVVFAAIHFRYLRLEEGFLPGRLYDILLWLSILAIFSVGIYGIGKLF